MYIVVRELKNEDWSRPSRHPLIDTTSQDFMLLLEIAKGRAEEHARDIGVDKPIRGDNSFWFWSSATSKVSYRVEAI